MKKFLLGLVVGLVLAVLSGVVIVASLARLGDRRPSVASNSALILRLRGEMPEVPPVEVPIPWIGSAPPVTVAEAWGLLHNASSDARIKAVVLIPEGLDVGWGKLQELHAGLTNFRKSGKPLVAYLRSPRLRDYYLATAADKIYVSPEDQVDVKGLRAELMFLRNTLDKLGVTPEVYHIGKYKDAGDMLTNVRPSPETLEVMNSILDELYGHVLSTISITRKKSVDDVRAIIDDGPYTSRQAQSKGLVDLLRYEDQMYGELKDRLKGEFKKLNHRDYLRAIGPASSGKKIAYVVGSGAIYRASAESESRTDETLGSGPFIKLLQKVYNDKSIDGVILRVDSPGGDASASDEILREVKLLSEKKPTVISMSDVAASGGYYISMTGDPILAYPGTITGSIGIVYGKVNLKGLYDKLGITKEILTRGKNATVDSDYVPLSEEGKTKLVTGMKEFYDAFVSKAAAARKRKYQDIEPLAQGRVWMGSQAKGNGLIDENGGIDRAIEMVKQRAKIRPDEKIRLVPFPGKRSVFDELFRVSQENMETDVESRLGKLLGVDLKLWRTGGLMRVMPYSIKFQ